MMGKESRSLVANYDDTDKHDGYGNGHGCIKFREAIDVNANELDIIYDRTVPYLKSKIFVYAFIKRLEISTEQENACKKF